MTQRGRVRRILACVLLVGLLCAGSGCTELAAAATAGGVGLFGAGFTTGFGTGFLTGSLLTPTETTTQCYRNGELVDCSEIETEE